MKEEKSFLTLGELDGYARGSQNELTIESNENKSTLPKAVDEAEYTVVFTLELTKDNEH
ncbi:hypothetical protein GLW07_17365 [Bacillus hwajinpoensis]|uniref:Uncharacterized protein n=1 Tax=Guptibacillus hwajinpoensis TaxID=208199 RepID=A0A845F2W2_9BACL|nr:hypothetical protein [Pseudalkalibacillus hwajinpoensis]MYL65130.1 hypothetical protein [Pseudalkalibacillus hwajinpoensis]